MPQKSWSAKRERQFRHITQGLQKRGDSEPLAEEIAARTVNKARARAGESRQASATSLDDILVPAGRAPFPPGRRRSDQSAALRRSSEKGCPGSLEHEQGGAGTSAPMTTQLH